MIWVVRCDGVLYGRHEVFFSFVVSLVIFDGPRLIASVIHNDDLANQRPIKMQNFQIFCAEKMTFRTFCFEPEIIIIILIGVKHLGLWAIITVFVERSSENGNHVVANEMNVFFGSETKNPKFPKFCRRYMNNWTSGPRSSYLKN